MNTQQPINDFTLVSETPQLHAKTSVVSYIEQEVKRPSKQWITSIISGDQEKEHVVIRTDDFVLLPDTERVNRYWRIQTNAQYASSRTPKSPHTLRAYPRLTLNWLSIVNDHTIRTMRDLRGKHVPMLKTMLATCMAAIEEHTGIPQDQVMAYVHYPPSVYQLHVHFSHPYGQYCHRNAYRVHSLGTIISNLEIDSDYYTKATLSLAMYKQSQHYQALTAADEIETQEKNNSEQ